MSKDIPKGIQTFSCKFHKLRIINRKNYRLINDKNSSQIVAEDIGNNLRECT